MDLQDLMIRGHECFTSFSGEAGLIPVGARTVFFRFGGCNLHCEWCDTPETINPVETKMSSAIGWLEKIEAELAQNRTSNLIVTGGEPLQYQGELVAMLFCIKRAHPFITIQVETNGSFIPSEELSALVDCFVYDIKPPSSGYEGSTNPNLGKYIRTHDVVKLVCVEPDDLVFYMHGGLSEFGLDWVFLNSNLVSFSVNQETGPAVVEAIEAMETPYPNLAINMQMHKLLNLQ